VILARGAQPIEIRRGLPGDPDDTHSRYIEAAIDGIIVGCLYLPNGNQAPGPKFDFKLRWFDRLAEHAESLLATGEPVVLASDYNVMPTDLDVYAPERWVDDALFRPLSNFLDVDLSFEPVANARVTDEVGGDVHRCQRERRILGGCCRISERNIGERQEQPPVSAAHGVGLLVCDLEADHEALLRPAIEEWAERVEKRTCPEQRLNGTATP
jgi:hypothetical protein